MLHALVVVGSLWGDLVFYFDRCGASLFEQANGPRHVYGIAEANTAVHHHGNVNPLGDCTTRLAHLGRGEESFGNAVLIAESTATKVNRVETATDGERGRERVESERRHH
jgi:hypothetical protein